MSTFERDGYKWRETYFVLFDACKRPTLKHIQKVLSQLHDRFEFVACVADEDGRFESMTVLAPDDYAALDISYVAGEEVLEQGAALYEEMLSSVDDEQEREKLKRLRKFDARFDLLHFEHMTEAASEDEMDEMLDPSALLLVMEALAHVTKGVGVDPQSGTLV